MVQSRFKIYLEEAGVKRVAPGVSKFCFKLKMFDVVDHFFVYNNHCYHIRWYIPLSFSSQIHKHGCQAAR